MNHDHRRELPSLGARGEGWFLVQVAILAMVGIGGLAGPAWSGTPRTIGLVAGAILVGAGGSFAVRGIWDLGSNLTVFPRPRQGSRLVETGAYRLVRHPIYWGLILGAIGWGLATASPLSLVAAAVLAGFFDLKSRREEAWLAREIDGYDRYRRRTRRLVPWIY